MVFRRQFPLRDSSNQSVWVQSVLGGEAHQIGPEAPNSAVREYKNPVWSPDGRYVLFSSRMGDTVPDALRSQLYVMGMDGSIRQVTNGPHSYSEPRFARDGRRILALGADPQGGAVLTSFALDGRDARPVFVASTGFELNGRKFSYLEYAVSPDGRSLAVNDYGSVYTVEASGRVVRARTRGAVYSPVAGRIAYADEPEQRLITAGGENYPQHPLETLSLTGGDGRLQTVLAKPSGRESDSEPDWRPTVPRAPVPDLTPPALDVSAGTVSSSSIRRRRSGYPRVKRDAIRFLTFDASGIRRVDASLARVVSGRKAKTACRLLGPRSFGPRRSCRRTRYRVVASPYALTRTLGRVGAGRYRLDMQARDVNGRRAKARTVRFSLGPRRHTPGRR